MKLPAVLAVICVLCLILAAPFGLAQEPEPRPADGAADVPISTNLDWGS